MAWIIGQVFLLLFLVMAEYADEDPADMAPADRRKRSKGIWYSAAGMFVLAGLAVLWIVYKPEN